jgi:formiminoglutamase
MSDSLNIIDFLEPVNLAFLSEDEGYKDGQLGKNAIVFEQELPEITADIIILGCPEIRGSGVVAGATNAPNAIRRQFYSLYNWHQLDIADLGNIKQGADLNDTYAALKLVIRELNAIGKTVIVLGGGHDLTLAQYYSYRESGTVIDVTCVDALIDIDINSPFRSNHFLMEMLTGEPNFIRHYNHIGFQSFYVHPHMLETMDKLRFDCFRVGHVKESLEEMEPVIRNSQLFSFDISSIANAFAPANTLSPNGFTGEEACALMRYAGLSPNLTTAGIYGYRPENDVHDLTAKQIAHMMWYFIDGRSKGRREAALNEKEAFNEYHTAFAEVATTFLQSKRTGRWWMQLPDQQFIACSYRDYVQASNNEIPERWLRAQERN